MGFDSKWSKLSLMTWIFFNCNGKSRGNDLIVIYFSSKHKSSKLKGKRIWFCSTLNKEFRVIYEALEGRRCQSLLKRRREWGGRGGDKKRKIKVWSLIKNWSSYGKYLDYFYEFLITFTILLKLTFKLMIFLTLHWKTIRQFKKHDPVAFFKIQL